MCYDSPWFLLWFLMLGALELLLRCCFLSFFLDLLWFVYPAFCSVSMCVTEVLATETNSVTPSGSLCAKASWRQAVVIFNQHSSHRVLACCIAKCFNDKPQRQQVLSVFGKIQSFGFLGSWIQLKSDGTPSKDVKSTCCFWSADFALVDFFTSLWS